MDVIGRWLRVVGVVMITVLSNDIDKISLLRVYKEDDKEDFNSTLGLLNNYAKDGYFKKFKNKHGTVFTKPYEGKFESTALSFSLFSVKHKPAIAIKFCPSKLTDDEWADALSWFTCLIGVGEVWDKFWLSSIEIRVDIRLPFSDLVYFAPMTKTTYEKYLEKGTTYIGAEKGRRSFRVYDKQKHLAEKKKKQLSHPLTRVEVIHRSLKLRLNEIEKLENHFGRLIALRKDVLKRTQSQHPTDTGFCEFCNHIYSGVTGHNAYWAMDKETRKRIVKLIQPHAVTLNMSEEKLKVWLAARQELLNKLKFA